MDAVWSPIARIYDPLKAGSIDGTDVKPHDHGIVRAMEATYKTNKYVKTDPRLTIFVSRLCPTTTEDTIKEFFTHYGDVKSCHLIRDVVTGFSKRYAFVEFYDARDALAASSANNMLIDDCKVFVDFEKERMLPGWIPRRLGGGFGGKKESGQLRFGGLDRPFKKPIILGSKGGAYSSEAFNDRSRQFPHRREGRYLASDHRARDHDRRDSFIREKKLSYERSRDRHHEGDHRSDRSEKSYGRPYESSSDHRRKHEGHSGWKHRDEHENRERRSRRCAHFFYCDGSWKLKTGCLLWLISSSSSCNYLILVTGTPFSSSASHFSYGKVKQNCVHHHRDSNSCRCGDALLETGHTDHCNIM
ncbi:U11/U12 small nuclear ribonucleoprotein 35 kDa protein-like isoform X5 [Dermacentor albipictus]